MSTASQGEVTKSTEAERTVDARRKFLKRAAQAAIVAPAVAVLVQAATAPKEAAAVMYTSDPGPWIP